MASLASAQDQDDVWLVVREEYRSSYGCYSGHPPLTRAQAIHTTEYEVRGEYDTQAAAASWATKLMRGSDHFEDWAGEHYGEDPTPPYDSAEGENYDNDDEIRIYVQRKSGFENARQHDADFLQRAHAEALAAEQEALAAKKEAVAAAGVVHYSWPPDADIDIPAEFEAVIFQDGGVESKGAAGASQDPAAAAAVAGAVARLSAGAFLAARGKAPGTNTSATVKTCMLECGDDAPPLSVPFQDAAIALLRPMVGLEELHLHRCFRGRAGEVAFVKRLHTEVRHLPRTLKVLSIPHGDFGPDRIEELAKGRFAALEELRLKGSISMSHGADIEMPDPYDSDGGEAPELPFDEPLLHLAQSAGNLLRIDLSGILDFSGIKWCMSYEAIEEIESTYEVEVELGEQEHW